MARTVGRSGAGRAPIKAAAKILTEKIKASVGKEGDGGVNI